MGNQHNCLLATHSISCHYIFHMLQFVLLPYVECVNINPVSVSHVEVGNVVALKLLWRNAWRTGCQWLLAM